VPQVPRAPRSFLAALAALVTLVLLPGTGAVPAAAQEAPPAEPVPDERGWFGRVGSTLGRDYKHFYAKPRLIRFGGVVGGAGLLANTSGDEEIRDWYREDVRTGSLDDLADDVNFLGREGVVLPLVLGGLALGLTPEEGHTAAGRWVRRSARAYFVGAPVLVYMQTLLGADRPVEGMGSDWKPFDGQNGVSGHAFIGAVPLLTIARQADRKWVKGAAILASTAAGWSQFHLDQHYLSQYLLGWWLAWESTGAVAEASPTWDEGPELSFAPLPVPEGAGVLVRMSF
jgi:hypothetical protein